MKRTNPKVSIIIPVYNGSNYLKEAIDSALAQTYKNTEVIVVNDGSTDNGATDKIAKSYGDKIKYYSKENGGVATALNYGVKKMTGEYFSWLSHDDKYENNKIAEQVKLLNTFDKDLIIACNACDLFEDGTKKNTYIDKSTFNFIDVFLATSAIVGVNGCSLLIPRKGLIDSGGFDPNLPVTQDYDLWFRLKDKYDFVLLENNLVISRRHEGQDSVQKQKMCFEAGEAMHYRFLNKVPGKRFGAFFSQEQHNVDNYIANYRTYKAGGYRKTASMMLKHLFNFYLESESPQCNILFESEAGKIEGLDLMKGKKSKPRILIFSNVWHRGGIERVLSYIFEHFEKKYDFILATLDDGLAGNEGYPLPESVSWLRVNNKDHVGELLNAASLLEVDLFIGNPNFSASFLDIYPLLKDTNTKTIAYNHGYYYLPYTTGEYLYPTALKIKESYSAADYVIWLTELSYNIYALENGNGIYIANPARIIKSQKPKAAAGKNLLSVGRFDDEIKQIDKILLVFKELYGRDPDYHLDVVGHCPMNIELPRYKNQKLSDFITSQNIPTDNIKFWGEQKNVSKFYDRAHFLISASRNEGFPMVLIEALSRGVPCAAFDYIGIGELIQNGTNGIVVAQGEVIELAESIDRTIQNESLYLQMSKISIKSVEKYDQKVFYEKWEKLFNHIFKLQPPALEELRPEQLKSEDYKKIILENEKMMNALILELIDYRRQINEAGVKKRSRLYSLSSRALLSLRREGFRRTGKKASKKVIKKINSRLKTVK